jgi:hypothetical protein
MVNKLCKYYEITGSEIELAFNGLSALNKAFSYASILHVDDSNYDLLININGNIPWFIGSFTMWLTTRMIMPPL